MPDRLVKHARFARSGVYEYAAREIPDLGLPLPPPESIGEKNLYRVYRPANVLSSAVRRNLFTRMPLTRGHPREWVDPDNFRDFTVGFTGDAASIEYLADCDEVAVAGTLTIADAEAFDAYEHGVTELSPGYRAEFVWSKGEVDGRSYDAIMTNVIDTNHLALVNKGRGGATAAILDQEAGTNVRKIVSGLWHKARRKLGMVQDEEGRPASQSSGFGPGLRHLVEARATKYPEEIKRDLENVREMASDLPDGDEKALLMRYMDDLQLMKEMKDDSALEAINIVCSLYDKLDKAAMEEGDSEDKKARDAMAEDAMKDCGNCGGSGKIKDETCPTCKGTGKIGAKDEVKEPPKAEVKEPPKGEVKIASELEGDVEKAKKETVRDEPDPSVPAAVPPAPPKPAAAAPAPQPPSPSPGGVPAAPAAPAPATGAPAAGGAAFFMKQLATLLQAMMADPEIKAMAGQAPAPAAAAPAPAAPAPPKPAAPQAAAPSGAPAAPPGGKPADEMPSLAATVSPSGGDSPEDSGRSLEGVLESILNKGKRG